MLFVAIAIVALAAFTIEGAIGFGGTVIAASVGAQLVPLPVLLPGFVVVNLALSGYLLTRGRHAIAWRLLLVQIAPPVAVGAAVGIALWHLPAVELLALIFGVFVVGLAAFQLIRPASTRPLPPALRIVLLAIGGLAHGLFGTGGPMIVYVVRRRLPDKAAFRATLAVLWISLNVALVANFISLGAYTRQTAMLGATVALALAPGLMIGERLHRALDPARFERVVWIVLLLAGLALAIRSAVAVW
jgi:uncharacterized membrane protein YfcA